MTQLDDKLRAVGAMWGGAEYERIAELFAPIHDRLVEALEPCAGERWLDLATGTGEVALRAARRGAEVTAVDLSEPLLEQGRRQADSEGLRIEWLLADVQRLPLDGGSFDVVSSCFGVIFPPDRAAVAGELARVLRPGGRLGVTSWTPDEAFKSIWAPFVDSPPPSEPDPWVEPGRLRKLLGGEFELAFEYGEWAVERATMEEHWDLFARAGPPSRALHDSLPPERRDELRRVFVEAHERYRTPNGVRVSREFLLALGRRR